MSRERLPILGQGDSKKNQGDSKKKLCPSYTPRGPGSGWVFGVVAGDSDRPEMIPLESPEPVTEEIFEMVAPFHPSEVFRIAAPCVEGRCKNFGEGTCHLARHTAEAPQRAEKLKPCPIRSRCLWWDQEGAEACRRCPGVVTGNSKSISMREKLVS